MPYAPTKKMEATGIQYNTIQYNKIQYRHRFYTLLNVQNYWVFGLFPSSCILGTKKQNVSENGSVSILRCGGEDTYSVGSLRQS
jgi:hypothetical protein